MLEVRWKSCVSSESDFLSESLDGKPQPLRLLIRPYNPQMHASRPHPSVLIHKHSRAYAFSIFRACKLRTTHMSASHCVLLAPLKVQVHYTETRSTRALKTYNFLNDREEEDRGEYSSAADRNSDRWVSPTPMDVIEIGPSSSTPIQPIAGPSNPRSSPHLPTITIPQASQRAPISPLPEEEEDGDSENDSKLYMRKSHADAFATLDDKQLEAHRLARLSPPEPTPIPVEVNRMRQSRLGSALKRAFSGAAAPQSSPTSADKTPTPDDVGGVFNPPWLTLPPRSLQEKNARTLHQLNKSFEDVGLLPTRRRGGQMPRAGDVNFARAAMSGKARSTASSLHGEAFDIVPDDSPVMLLPMWANEGNTVDEEGKGKKGSTCIPIHERRYLLIYYVSFSHGDGTSLSSRELRSGKKRARPSTGGSTDLSRSPSDGGRHHNEYLTAFRVVAKVLSYDDVRTSGLRLPNEGIEISPVMPNSPLPDKHFNVPPKLSNFGDTMVIAICPSPESTIEFVPEGLDKLGLCYRPGDLPISSIAEPTESERLSPVGRAIVEMAWVGCLSVMGLASTL